MLRRFGAAIVVAIGVVLGGTAAVVPAAAGVEAVAVRDYAFSPGTLTVPAGTTVTWTNYDVAPHTVTEVSGPVPVSSPELHQGQSWSFTFEQPGTYRYYCAVHPNMLGSVVVTPAAVPRTELALAPVGTAGRTAAAGGSASAARSGPRASTSAAGVADAPAVASAGPTPAQDARPLLVLAGVAIGVAGLATLAVRARPH